MLQLAVGGGAGSIWLICRGNGLEEQTDFVSLASLVDGTGTGMWIC